MIILTATKRFLKEPTYTKPRPKRDLHPDYRDPMKLAKFVITNSLSRLSSNTKYKLSHKYGREFTFEFNIDLWGYPEFNACRKTIYDKNGRFLGKFDNHNIFNIIYDDIKSSNVIVNGSPLELTLSTIVRRMFEKHVAGRPEIDGRYSQYENLSINTLHNNIKKLTAEYGFDIVALTMGPMIKYYNNKKEYPSIKIKFTYNYDNLKSVWGKKN